MAEVGIERPQSNETDAGCKNGTDCFDDEPPLIPGTSSVSHGSRRRGSEESGDPSSERSASRNDEETEEVDGGGGSTRPDAGEAGINCDAGIGVEVTLVEDDDSLFDELWKLIAVPVDWCKDKMGIPRLSFPGGNPKWEEFTLVFEKVHNAERKRRIAQWKFPGEDRIKVSPWSKGEMHILCEPTLLHAACSRQPPVEIVQSLLEADETKFSVTDSVQRKAYEVLVDAVEEKGTTEANGNDGWTTLHLACEYNASVEVVRALLDADREKVTIEARDEYGKTPLHIACQLGDTSVEVVRALLDADEDKVAITAQDMFGCMPLHVECEHNASTEVVRALLDADEKKVAIAAENNDGLTALDLYANTKEKSSDDEIHSLLALHTPIDNGHYFESLKKIVEANMESSFDNDFVQQTHEAMRKLFPTFVLMADLNFNIVLVVMYTLVSASPGDFADFFRLIYLSLMWMTIREISEIYVERFLWLKDAWNWLDAINIVLAFLSTGFMHAGKIHEDGIRTLVMATGFLIWIHTVSSLRSTFLDFAVFVSGIVNVVIKLIPFLITIFLLLGGFAYLYYMNNVNSLYDMSSSNRIEGFSTFGDALFTTTAMMLNGVDEDFLAVGQEDATVKWLSFAFALVMVVLLLNVIIAIVSSSWEEVTGKGKNVFLRNRLAFLIAINQLRLINEYFDEIPFSLWLAALFVPKESRDRPLWLQSWDPENPESPVSWSALKMPFLYTVYCYLHDREYPEDGSLWMVTFFVAAYIVAPLLFFLGIGTFGLAWPEKFRQFVFGVKVDERQVEAGDRNGLRNAKLECEIAKMTERQTEIVELRIAELENKMTERQTEAVDKTESRIADLEKKIDKITDVLFRINESMQAREQS